MRKLVNLIFKSKNNLAFGDHLCQTRNLSLLRKGTQRIHSEVDLVRFVRSQMVIMSILRDIVKDKSVI